VAERIMPMKNSSDTIGNRMCDLPACSATTIMILNHSVIFAVCTKFTNVAYSSLANETLASYLEGKSSLCSKIL
jgi:hypothetical protein